VQWGSLEVRDRKAWKARKGGAGVESGIGKAEFENGTERDERGERRVEPWARGQSERLRHNYNGTRSRRGCKREAETEGRNCTSEGRKGRE
jgi:hypothetical protein